MPRNAVVIGSGIAGIASAIRLQLKGFQVDVFERNNYPGGKLTEVSLEDFRFDAGPSLFTMPDYVDELFRLAGKNPRDYFEYSKLEEVCSYFWDDGTVFKASSDRNNFAQAAAEVFNCESNQIIEKLNKAAFIESTTGKLFLEQSLHDWRGFVNKETLLALARFPKLGIGRTLHEVNKASFNDDKLVQLFDRYATYNGSDPYRTPGIMEVIPHYEYNVGAFFPKKGMVDIIRSLVRLSEDLGVKYHFNQEVERIVHHNNEVSGIKTNQNDFVKAECVVSNMDVFFTYNKLLKDVKIPVKRLSQERSSSGLIFYWGIDGIFDELGVHNIFFSNDYEAEFKSIFQGKTAYHDPTVYVHVSSKIKKDDAPVGKENWFVMVNTPSKGTIDWESYIRESRDYVIQKLSRNLKCDISKLICQEETMFPEKIETKTCSYQGSLYGASSNSKYAAFLRQPNFHKKLKGLYFVGGSVHPGGGIPLCLLSAKIAADHV